MIINANLWDFVIILLSELFFTRSILNDFSFYVDQKSLKFSTTDLETVFHKSSELFKCEGIEKALILADNSTLSTCRQTINNI